MKTIFLIGLILIGFYGLKAQEVVNVGEKWGTIDKEQLGTFKFSNDTMTIAEADGIVAYGFKAHPSNTGDVYMEGMTMTIDGHTSTDIPFDAGEAFNDGLLIAIQDTVIFSSRAAADTCIVTLKVR